MPNKRIPNDNIVGINDWMLLIRFEPEKSRNPIMDNMMSPPTLISIAPNNTIKEAPTLAHANTGMTRMKLMVSDFTSPMHTNVDPELVKVTSPSKTPPIKLEKKSPESFAATARMRWPASDCIACEI